MGNSGLQWVAAAAGGGREPLWVAGVIDCSRRWHLYFSIHLLRTIKV
ncbi:MAG TPA: hypothetical protein PKN88_08280 [Bacillota bacterium]|nr:hypothetical protein [Bacillota bacterium]